MWRGDDREISVQGHLDLLIEAIASKLLSLKEREDDTYRKVTIRKSAERF